MRVLLKETLDDLPVLQDVDRTDVGVEPKAHSGTSRRPTLRCWRFQS